MYINKFIDYTNLRPNATEQDIINLCQIAKERGYATVCVAPDFVKFAAKLLKNTTVKVCTVVGFPLGANTLETKIFETKQAIKHGASEIDLVINLSKLAEGNYKDLLKEVNKIKHCIKDKILKIIVETAYLTEQQKIDVANMFLKSKADYIKTSTGFAPSGAEIADIVLWKKIIGSQKYIKAAGGIRTVEEALKFIDAGADRIGTSADLSK